MLTLKRQYADQLCVLLRLLEGTPNVSPTTIGLGGLSGYFLECLLVKGDKVIMQRPPEGGEARVERPDEGRYVDVWPVNP